MYKFNQTPYHNSYQNNYFDGLQEFPSSDETIYHKLKIAADNHNWSEYRKLVMNAPLYVYNDELKNAFYNDNLTLLKHLNEFSELTSSEISKGLTIAFNRGYNDIINYFWLP